MVTKRHPLPTIGAALLALLLIAFPAATGQHRSAEVRAAEIGQQVNQLSDRDPNAGRTLAWSASQDFRKEGERVLAGRFGLQALKLDAEVNAWQRLARDGLTARDELSKELDGDGIALFYNLLLHAQGMVGDREGQQKSVKAYIEKTVAMSGEDSKSEIMARIIGAYSFLETGDTQEGFIRLQSALRHAAAGKNYGLTLSEYTTAAQSFADSGQMAAAEAFYTEGLGTNAAKIESRELATLWFEYSRFLQRSGGDIDATLRTAQTAREMLQRQYGETSEEAISGGDNLASFLVNNGAVASGLNIQEEIYQTALSSLGNDVPLTWRTANNYAEALRMVDHPEVARGIDEALLKLRIAHYGHASIQALVSASNLGLDLLALGDRDGALKAFEEQRKIGLEIADPHSEHAAQGERWKEYTQAYFLRYARMDNKSLEDMAAIKDWRSAPDLMRIKTAQLAAEQFEMRDDTKRALALRQEAYEISKGAFGELHPLTFDALLEVATTHMRRKDAETLQSFQQLDERMFDWMLREVGSSGNRYVAETTRRLADDMLRTFGEFALSSPEAATLYADSVARWKTMESGERTRLRMAAETTTNPDVHKLAETVVRLLGQQQELLSSGDVDTEVRQILTELKATRDRLPKSLGQNIATQSVEDVLGTNAAMIDFFVSSRRARNGDADSADSRLQAIVRRKGEAPAIFDLGALGAIVRQAAAEENPDRRFGKLYQSLFGPLKGVLEDKTQLYIVPDGALYSIPFAMMKTDDGRHLDEAFEVHMLTREDAIFFTPKRDRPAPGEKALVVGDLKYWHQRPLPFTHREIHDVGNDLKAAGLDVVSLSGTTGMEVPIRKASAGASIIHLATHGFFDADTDEETTDALWRSGLIVAGKVAAQEPDANDNDGILYARELMNWDLSSTDLVVLSACQTALGDPSRIGNVRGLPTALAIAGARRSLLTLWSVDDEGTANFMARYYQILTEDKLDYAAALRRTRIEAISGKIDKASDPSLWAAFVLFEG
jgi:CHAT domain-containing protein